MIPLQKNTDAEWQAVQTERIQKILLLTLSWRRPLSYRNQSIDLRSKYRNKAPLFIWEICIVKYKIKRKKDDINNILCLIIYFQYCSIAQSYNIFVETIA